MTTILRLTQEQHSQLQAHLFPGDGKEAVAIMVCGRRPSLYRHCLIVRHIELIPYEDCRREEDRLTWPTERLIPLLAEASLRKYAILKVHSHPNGYRGFSKRDDYSDREFFNPVIGGWFDAEDLHGSAVMLPSGEMLGRWTTDGSSFHNVESICVVGDDLRFWRPNGTNKCGDKFSLRSEQAFGAGTISQLRNMSIAVVGCSGTGGPVIEQLMRYGVGRLVLVDPDKMGIENINRIPQGSMQDVIAGRLKVEVISEAIRRAGLGTEVVALPIDIATPEAVKAVAECDLAFGCMDGIFGRHILNRLATFYNLPYFDVGVKLVADGTGGVNQICGTIHYIQPGRSSLRSRGVYTDDELRAEAMKRTDPKEYAEQVKSKYIAGVYEERPAVISVNTLFASLAVNEFLARLHPYRDDPNSGFAVHRISLTQAQIYTEPEGPHCQALKNHVGRGDVEPLLDNAYLDSLSGRQS
jgi:hypothetical protein